MGRRSLNQPLSEGDLLRRKRKISYGLIRSLANIDELRQLLQLQREINQSLTTKARQE